MSETDEAVGRVTAYLAQYSPMCDSSRVDSNDKDSPTLADLRTLLAALARVTEERDAALRAVDAANNGEPCYCPKCGSCGYTGCCGLRCAYLPEHTESAKWYEDEIEKLTADLATLRERLAGEVGALRVADWPFCGHKADRCDCWARNAMLDRAVAVIRGEGKNAL